MPTDGYSMADIEYYWHKGGISIGEISVGEPTFYIVASDKLTKLESLSTGNYSCFI